MVEPSPEPSPAQRPLPPSLEEQRDYYHGLPSCPKLVARSSTIPWSSQYDGWPIPKCLYVIGEHAIVDLWNDADSSLRRQILQVVDKVHWTAIDVLRVGYDHDNKWTGEKFSRPVTILISVKTGSTLFEQGYDVVVACSRILQSHNLDDVQVEMKESEVSWAASTPPPAPLPTPALSTSSQATSNQLLQFSSQPLREPTNVTVLLSEYLGSSIAPSDSPRHEGTKCLYLQCGAKVFALTRRHVVFTDLHPNTKYQHDDTMTPHTVMQPGNGTWVNHINSIPDQIRDNKKYLDELEEMFNHGLWKGKTEQPKLQTLIQMAQAELDTNEALNERLAEWDNPSSRIFGHTTFSPAYSVGPILGRKEKRLRDWALIELHQEKHATPLTSLLNRIYIGTGGKELVHRQSLGWTGLRRSLVYNEHGVLVSGTIPETEMLCPRSRTMDGEKGILVLKYGPVTTFTTGITNQVKSITRWPCSDGKYESEEWCIIGHGKGLGGTAFSGDGDSGSCVFDTQGRIGGMLTGGLARKDTDNHDVSYVTPMEWLLEDIRRHGYHAELL
ncbi:hypothetical protein CEP53_001931 [Fusarium sp. AF-6]|nr:hypothetical protein CEP53_001931 [Fusarium sp. AF-6]